MDKPGDTAALVSATQDPLPDQKRGAAPAAFKYRTLVYTEDGCTSGDPRLPYSGA